MEGQTGDRWLDTFRTGKAYTIAQAAHLATTTPPTVRRWLLGSASPGHSTAPVFGKKSGEDPLLVSFLELVEIVVAVRFRRGSPGHPPLRLDVIRRAHAFARDTLGVPYPFASLKLREAGGHVMHEFDRREGVTGRMALDLRGQYELPLPVRAELCKHVDFNAQDTLAQRWWLQGRTGPVVVDPHVAGGGPTVRGRSITIDTLRSRWKAGEPIDALAQDYDLDRQIVEQALQYAAA